MKRKIYKMQRTNCFCNENFTLEPLDRPKTIFYITLYNRGETLAKPKQTLIGDKNYGKNEKICK